MKITIEIDTESPSEEFILFANPMYRVLSSFRDDLRAKVKYGESSEEIQDVYERLHESLIDEMIEAGIEHLF